MRLNKFINEDREQLKEFIKNVQKDCKPYLKLLKGRSPLTRGMKIVSPTDFGMKAVRKDRKSLIGHSVTIVKRINQYMDHINAARRDRSVIATSKFQQAMTHMFGEPYWIFPKGKFKYTFVRSSDFNWSGTAYDFDYAMAFFKDEMWKDPDSIPAHWKPGLWFETNKQFDEAYNKGYEIWFECDHYYYINLNIPLTAKFANTMKFMLSDIR